MSSISNPRQQAIAGALSWTETVGDGTAAEHVDALFGADVFGTKEMQQRLPKDAFKAVRRALETGERLSRDVADAVALAMKNWAVEQGATHYTHWFQPLTSGARGRHRPQLASRLRSRSSALLGSHWTRPARAIT